MSEGPKSAPDPELKAASDRPQLYVPPGYESRDHSNKATHLLTCAACGRREAWRTREPFGWVKALTAARKAGWHRIADPYGGPPALVCSDTCLIAETTRDVGQALERNRIAADAVIRASTGRG